MSAVLPPVHLVSSRLPVSAPALPDPLELNPGVWRAGELDSAPAQCLATGYAALDQALPGGGWPQGALIEVLQAQAGVHEWGLLAPALAALQQAAPAKLLVLVGAPWQPFGPALGARQLNMQRVVCVHSRGPALLWATREALQCADVAAVLAWLPDARSAHLRRLQIAAHTHGKLLFVFRPLRAQLESSPAPLRLRLEGAVAQEGNLQLHVFKRRGPPLAAPLWLATQPARLSALLLASRERTRRRRDDFAQAPAGRPAVPAARAASLTGYADALLDRVASLHPH